MDLFVLSIFFFAFKQITGMFSNITLGFFRKIFLKLPKKIYPFILGLGSLVSCYLLQCRVIEYLTRRNKQKLHIYAFFILTLFLLLVFFTRKFTHGVKHER